MQYNEQEPSKEIKKKTLNNPRAVGLRRINQLSRLMLKSRLQLLRNFAKSNTLIQSEQARWASSTGFRKRTLILY